MAVPGSGDGGSGRRILMCSMAVPWPSMPLLGSYHLMQARALRELGVEMRLFSPAPGFPGVLGRFSSRVRRHLERPERYTIDDVVTCSPRVPFAFPRVVRFQLAPLMPEVLQSTVAAAVGPALMAMIDEWQPDAILAHGVVPWGRLVTESAERLGVPVGFIEHSADEVMRLAPGTRLADSYVRYARRARSVMAVGPHMEVHLRSRLGLTNTSYLKNGASFATEEQIARPRPPELEGRIVLLAAASYYRRKGFEELVSAFETIAHRRADVLLHVITDAPRSLRAAIDDAHDGIRLSPPMPREELMQWMAWADLFVLPSWSEAFGLAYVEALGARTPIVLTDDCGLRDSVPVVRAGECDEDALGWSVPPRDDDALVEVLEEALSDPARLERIGARSREFVEERFTWRENAATLLELMFGNERAPDARPRELVAEPV